MNMFSGMHAFLQTFLHLEEITHTPKVVSQPKKSIHEDAVSVNQLTVYWPKQKNLEEEDLCKNENGSVKHDKVNFHNLY